MAEYQGYVAPGEMIRDIVDGLLRPVTSGITSGGTFTGDIIEDGIRFVSELVALVPHSVLLLTAWVPALSESLTRSLTRGVGS